MALFAVLALPAAPLAAQGEVPGEATAAEPSRSTPPVQFVGPGEGLRFASDDGAYALILGARLQLRGTLRVPSGADAIGDFSIPRARVLLSGHLFGEDNRFDIELALSPDDLGWTPDEGLTLSPVLDATVSFHQLRDLTLVVGQRKIQLARERITSSGELAMVDRSIVDDALSLDRDLGLWVQSTDLLGLGWLRYWAGLTSGEGRDGFVGDDLDFAYHARVEVLPLGLFDSYTQGDLQREPQPRLALALAYAYLDDTPWLDGLDGPRPTDGGTTDYHVAAFDALFLFRGLTAEVDVLMRLGRRRPGTEGPVTPPSDGLGGFVQLSYLLPETFVELTARYAQNVALGDDTSFRDRGALGGAVSLYFEGHPLCLQLDYFHLWDGTDPVVSGEERVRLQLQATL